MTQNETKKNRDLRDIIIFIIMVLLALTAVIVSAVQNKKDREMCASIKDAMNGSAFTVPSIANYSEEATIPQPPYRKETYCGHTYVIRLHDCDQMVHDPDCSCQKKNAKQ